MRSEVRETFDWQAEWIPVVRQIVGARLLVEAEMQADREEATDLIVLESPGMFRVACRLRTPGYVDRFPYDVTVTCRRETGWSCEWDKMVLGDWGDWFFYGHTTTDSPDDGGSICPWYIIDLAEARRWMRDNHGSVLGPNRDRPGRRCWFYAFDVREMAFEAGSCALVDWRPRAPWQEIPSFGNFLSA